MKKLSSPENFALAFLSIITLATAPFFVDSVMLPRFLVLNLYSITILIFILNSVKDFYSLSKFLTLITVSFPIILLISTSNSNQSLYENLFGMWGRYNGFLTYFALPVLFIFGVLIYSAKFSQKLLELLATIGLFLVVVGGLELLDINLYSYLNRDPYIKLTLGNSNFASIFLVMTFIATLTIYLFHSPTKSYKNLLFFSLISHIYLIIGTRAFQGLGALALSTVFLLWYYASTKLKNRPLKLSKLYFFTTVFTLITASYLVIELKIISFISLFDRFYIWTAALGMMKDYPLFGVGVDAFGKWFPAYKQTETIQYQGNFENYDSAHNIFLNIGATLGLPMLISYFSIVLFVFYRIYAIRKSFSTNPTIVGLVCIWMIFQMQALVSIDHIVILVWGWLIGGVIVGYSYRIPSDLLTNVPKTSSSDGLPPIKSELKIKLLIPIIILQFIFIFYAFPTVKSEILMKNYSVKIKYINKQKEIGNVSADVIKLSIETNAKIFETSSVLRSEDLRIYGAVVLANSGEQELAIKLTQSTIDRFPRSINARTILAQIYESKGELELANKYFSEILALDPLDQEVKNKLVIDK